MGYIIKELRLVTRLWLVGDAGDLGLLGRWGARPVYHSGSLLDITTDLHIRLTSSRIEVNPKAYAWK